MKYWYPTVAQVIRLHDYQLQRFGGFSGIRSIDLLESAVAQPMATFQGRDLYRGPAEKATALGFSLVQNHPFVDGNKRTGISSMIIFLSRNDHRIAVTPIELMDAIERVAGKEPRLDRAGLLELISTWTVRK